MGAVRKTITWAVDSNGCWNCISHSLGTHGYPILWKNNRSHNMHRILYEEAYGNLPKGLLVRHKCDNRACVNLDHLESGTVADNSADTTIRNRHNPPHGERSGTAKLTKEQVEIIKNTVGSQYKIAEQYGITQSQVSRIKNGKRWHG